MLQVVISTHPLALPANLPGFDDPPHSFPHGMEVQRAMHSQPGNTYIDDALGSTAGILVHDRQQ